MSKPGGKSPYRNFTEEEIRRAEENAYLIQLGIELFDYKKQYSFDLKTAEKYHHELLTGLQEMLADPTKKKDRPEVLSTLINLRILPLRIH